MGANASGLGDPEMDLRAAPRLTAGQRLLG
jgi:hypothetical protein